MRTHQRHRRGGGQDNVLLIAWGSYTAASLLHYAHNAELLAVYPNLPQWLTRPQVYVAWLALAILGLIGYLLTKSRHVWVGLALLAVYGLLGFDGLTHYLVAPVSAHTGVMNATIFLEAATAAVLLIALLRVVRITLRERRDDSAPASLSSAEL